MAHRRFRTWEPTEVCTKIYQQLLPIGPRFQRDLQSGSCLFQEGHADSIVCVEDQAVFSMAGIWETWSNNGTAIQSVAIITTDANDIVAELHDRMPVILDRDEEQAWLETDDEQALQELLDPFPASSTRSYEVTTAVNNPGNDDPELIEPLGTDQSGLGDFS